MRQLKKQDIDKPRGAGKWSPYGIMAEASLGMKQSTGSNPFKKELIKAAAINTSGGGGLLTGLMEEVDSLSALKESLEKQLEDETSQHSALETHLAYLSQNLFSRPKSRLSRPDSRISVATSSVSPSNNHLFLGGAQKFLSRGASDFDERSISSSRTPLSSAAATFPPTPASQGVNFGRVDSGTALTAPNPGRSGAAAGGGKRERTKILRSFLWGSEKKKENPSNTKPPRSVLRNKKEPKIQKNKPEQKEEKVVEVENQEGEEDAGENAGESVVETVLVEAESAKEEEEAMRSDDTVVDGVQTPTEEPPPKGTETKRNRSRTIEDLRSTISSMESTIINESTEISKLETMRGNLQDRVLELKRDVEEYKVGWKRSWARCEREIGELAVKQREEKVRADSTN